MFPVLALFCGPNASVRLPVKWVTVLRDEKKISDWRQGKSGRHVARDVCARRKGRTGH